MRRNMLPMLLLMLTSILSLARAGQLPDLLGAQHETLLLAPGDLIHINVFDVPELEQKTRINDAGSVTFALIGQQKLAGQTPAQAASIISKALAAGGFMQHAQVNVLVEQYAAAAFSVSGEVQHPGAYPTTVPRNLMDVLSLAGGRTPAADIHITIKRRGPGGETIAADLPNDADVALLNSVLVYPGDLVIVPRAGVVYVLGDVARPGGYIMSNDAQITFMQAIALASGTSKTASEVHARLVRQSLTGPVEIPLSLKAMEKGQQPDVALKRDDVIYVPYSTGKNIMLGASAILSSTGGAAIYATR